MNFVDFILRLFDFKTALLVALVFVPLERLLPLKRTQSTLRKGWGNDLIFMLFNRVLVSLGVVLTVVAIMQVRGYLIPASVFEAITSQPLWLQVPEVLLLADLGFYLAHRLFHAVPFLWRLHSLHHSIEEMDWLAAFRVHPLDQITTTTASIVALVMLGYSDAAIAVYILTYRWHSLLLHSNVRLKLGRLGLFVATPEFHHWHHSKNLAARDKNFAGQFAFWDVLFGTSYLPKYETNEGYGIDDTLPANYIDQIFYPFRTRSGVAAARQNEIP